MAEIKVTREGDRWVARFPWSVEVKDLVKAAGFRFDPQTKTWWTQDEAIVQRLQGNTAQITERLNQQREAEQAAAAEAIEASRALDADIKIPAPKGYEYLGYQKGGVAYCLDHEGVLLADEMGLGKTIQALGLINAKPKKFKRVLIVCLASHRLNWAKEAYRWLVRKTPIYLANGSFPVVQEVKGVTTEGVLVSQIAYDGDEGVVITNYESVVKCRRHLDIHEWDLLIVDECQAIKNSKAQRTQAILGYYDPKPDKLLAPLVAGKRLFLTGTPILNRPIELWNLCKSLDPKGLGRSWKYFIMRYCNASYGQWGWDTSGASHLDELQAKLRASFMIRRLKSEVLTDLPPKRRQIITLTPDSKITKAAVDEEQRMVRQASTEKLQALMRKLEALDSNRAQDAYEQAADDLERAARVAFVDTSEVRHAVALAKVPQVIEHVEDVLESEDKVVVFAYHHDVIEKLAEAFAKYGVVTMYGNITMKQREAAKDQFQTDPKVRVIVGSIPVMGTGWTLTAARVVVFAEMDWVPGNMSQAEDRLHRIGQRDNVLVQHLVLNGTLDAKMADVIVRKQQVIDRALDQGEQLPEVELVVTPPERPERPEKPKPPTEEFKPEVVAAIHTGLQMLAGVCNYASTLDGQGFSKLDADFGHSLANARQLTQRQAFFGKRLVIKYRRQLPAKLLAIIEGE